jgi:predicted phosphodiesterase
LLPHFADQYSSNVIETVGGADGMRRIALLSDIHGNLQAFDAVLADIGAAGIDERYCLGDLVGYGPDPAGVIDRVRDIGLPTVRGNYDEGVGRRSGACGCYYATEQARADGAASYAFTAAADDDARAAWLAALPDDLRFEHEGLRVLLAHGSPRKINEYLLPDRTAEQLARLASDARSDVVCVGHVHVPYHRTIAADGGVIHYVSVGAVGKPEDGDPRACWTELTLGEDRRVEASFHRVEYDLEAATAAMTAAGLPETLVFALRSA